jgi:hypothetical protein
MASFKNIKSFNSCLLLMIKRTHSYKKGIDENQSKKLTTEIFIFCIA